MWSGSQCLLSTYVQGQCVVSRALSPPAALPKPRTLGFRDGTHLARVTEPQGTGVTQSWASPRELSEGGWRRADAKTWAPLPNSPGLAQEWATGR